MSFDVFAGYGLTSMDDPFCIPKNIIHVMPQSQTKSDDNDDYKMDKFELSTEDFCKRIKNLRHQYAELRAKVTQLKEQEKQLLDAELQLHASHKTLTTWVESTMLSNIINQSNSKLNAELSHTRKSLIETESEVERVVRRLMHITHMVDISQISKELGDDSTSCPICSAHIVDTVFIPCGHTICSSCSEMITTRCHYCRHEIASRNSLWLNGCGPVPKVQLALDC